MDYTIDGKCPESCGRCCTSILPLSDYEIKKINKYLKYHPVEPYNPNKTRNIFDTYYKDVCPFLDENKRCKIYIQRPEVCQWFMCDSTTTNNNFNHSDKHIINMLTTFFPNESCTGAPDISILDQQYQYKKEEVMNLVRESKKNG